ncbi:MAG: hypothetical protein ACREFD_14940 [Stellaceae bacterium]
MAYLDVSPMIDALRTAPEEFEMDDGWLHHLRSRHGFKFNAAGSVRIRANCDCALLRVKHDQAPELHASYRQWQANYWRPLEINREFASHFAARSPARRLLIAMAGRLQRWLIADHHLPRRRRDIVAVPAE